MTERSDYSQEKRLTMFKTYERLTYNEMFTHFIKNGRTSRSQSGFRHRDSCVNQSFSITHAIYKLFAVGFNVRSAFLDILKAFDKVWHEDIIFYLLCDFLRSKKQAVVLNGQVST